MITLMINAVVKLNGGNTFTVVKELPSLYEGYVTTSGPPWSLTMGATMFRSSGRVFDNLMNLYYDIYEPTSIELPSGLSKVTCDCGGFKTYNSMAEHYHSRWCQVYKKETHECESISWSC